MKEFKLKKEFVFIHKNCSYTILPNGFKVQESHYDCRCIDCLKDKLTETEELLLKIMIKGSKESEQYHRGNSRGAIKILKRKIAHIESGGYVGGTQGKRWEEPYYFFVTRRDGNNLATNNKNKQIVSGRFDRRVVEENPDLFIRVKNVLNK